jgi:Flp pilus assembly protein TadG
VILSHPPRNRRRGAIVPLTALLLVPLLAMMAFTIDVGWMVLVESNLQSAADSAALAGANSLMDGYVSYVQAGLATSSSSQSSIISTYEATAKAAAKQYAALNGAGDSSLTLLDSDIEFGYTNSSGTYTTPAPSGTYPNTIKVTLRRDSTANGALGLFFGPVLGTPTANLEAVAAATIYTANINSFQNVSGLNLDILPMTYDVNAWNNFLQTGQDPDGNTNTDANGLPDLEVYPSVKYAGNFGLLGLDDSHVGTSTLNGWITNGFGQSDVQTLLSNSASDETPLVPLSSHNQNILPSASTDGMGSWNWQGDTGMKTAVLHTLDNYAGQTYLLPLFQPLNPNQSSYQAGNGQGANYYYNIVQFVSIKIVSSNNGNKGGLVVEPSATVLNPNWVSLTNVVPAGSTSSTSFTFAPPKLSQ